MRSLALSLHKIGQKGGDKKRNGFMENEKILKGTTSQNSSQIAIDEKFMHRCLQLARGGMQNAKPNPMVGAVIVSADGRIIGEGYHVRCGEGHAEVNAFASVKPEDEVLLSEATIYVSLEPCSHWGKTPPCADLIVRKGVRRVVCGCIDPFSEVQGRGIRKLREAGIEVTVGVLEHECLEMIRRFVVFNTHHRPYIILKWAQTTNGIMGFEPGLAAPGERLLISTPFTQMLVHKLRAEVDAILVGHNTMMVDRPRLDVRRWSGPNPERMVLAHSNEGLPEDFKAFGDIDSALQYLYVNKRQALLVEGGAATLKAFIDRGLWDEIRVETAPTSVAGGTHAPSLPVDTRLIETGFYDGNTICRYIKM